MLASSRRAPHPALPAAVLAVLALAFPLAAQTPAGAPASVVPIPTGTRKVLEPAYMDTTVRACTDFFRYANGSWLKTDTIPAAFATSGVGKEMTDRNEDVVRAVLEDAMARRRAPGTGRTVAKLGTFYATCMDSSRAEAEGATPIRAELDRIAALRTRDALVREVAALQVMGVNAVFRFRPDADPKDAAHYVAWASQGGLGMPDRDYYTNADPASDSLRQKYVAHVTRLLTLAGETPTDAAADARRVVALETELAKASLTRVALRDPNAIVHPTTVAQLARLAPAVDWPSYFRSVGLTVPVRTLNVAEPTFFERASALLATAPLDDWRAYLRYHLVAAAAPWLSTPFAREDFAYRSLFTGAKAMLPRWKRCLREADADLGEALGEAYVARTFPPEARARARQVIDDIRAAFRDRLARLGWMSDATRRFALEKLAAMREKVGYPTRWRDYGALEVADGPFVANVFRANRFEWRRVIDRPGTPVDTTEWDMTVPTVNAYYNPTVNEMVFPAGALVAPTFDPAADDAANYGALGASWAGHELTHGFDDEGRHYDARGNLRDWWTAADSARFTAQAQRLVDQFNGYIQVDTFHVNGKLTLGENIADFGGLLTAYDALQRALERRGRPGPIDGLTPEQRFFVAYAQTWREHSRPERMRSRVLTDPHAPAEWRVNAPLSDMPQFAQAFGCHPGDPMVRPPEKVPTIW